MADDADSRMSTTVKSCPTTGRRSSAGGRPSKFDGEDWLSSYLSTTEYAKDPKIATASLGTDGSNDKPEAPSPPSTGTASGSQPEAATTIGTTSGTSASGTAITNSPGQAIAATSTSSAATNSDTGTPATNSAMTVTHSLRVNDFQGAASAIAKAAITSPPNRAVAAALAAAAALPGGGSPVTRSPATGRQLYSLSGAGAAGLKAKDNRRRSWAAPVHAVAVHGEIGTGSASRSASRGDTPEAATVRAGEEKGALAGGGGGGGGSTEKAAVLAAVQRAAAMANEAALTKSFQFEVAPPGKRTSISGSGRRASLDYTDLEAVRERVQQAANLWAVADESEQEEAEEQLAEQIAAVEEVAPAVAREKSKGRVSLLRRWLIRSSTTAAPNSPSLAPSSSSLSSSSSAAAGRAVRPPSASGRSSLSSRPNYSPLPRLSATFSSKR